MHYYKYHGLGNDYIVMDPSCTEVIPGRDNIKLICDRNYGVGSDGILYGPVFEDGNIVLRIFNPDGSEAEKSGNGVRIFSRYLYEKGYVGSRNFSFLTKGGKVVIDIIDENAAMIRVNMGPYTFRSSLIPVSGKDRDVINEDIDLDGKTYRMTCVSVGNPHCVIPLAEISPELARRIGPLVENNPLFPNRINMQLLKVLDRNSIRIEIWERGAGYTLASGSSSCAASLAAYRLGKIDNHVRVSMPGGIIDIDIDGDYVKMTGPVESVSEGNFTNEFISKLMIRDRR